MIFELLPGNTTGEPRKVSVWRLEKADAATVGSGRSFSTLNSAVMPASSPWTTLTTRPVYDNPWISVRHDEVRNPGGGHNDYGVVHFKNLAIGVVPVDAEGYTWLVGQHRYVLDRYEWEIPEGGCPLGTDPVATAHRELKEETGLTAGRMLPLLDFNLSNSVTDEYGIAYLALDLTVGEAEPEETEDLTLRRLPLSEAIALTLDGTIRDSVSIMALQRVALLQHRGELPDFGRGGEG